MHSDTSITYDRVAEAVNLMLRNTPPELKILTRTGNYSAKVLGFDNWGVDFHIDGEKFAEIAKAKGDTMYRVGMFNDGYLGTQYDYGTWGADCKTSICREEGVAWLEKYSINTPYGGEALTTASGYQVINTPEFLAYEGFRTHTSYLNIQWNYDLINEWKRTPFRQKDFDYDPARVDSLSGFKYIDDHLGYRFVLRESWLSDTVGSDGILRAKLRIQNVGFGNLTRKMKTALEIRIKKFVGNDENDIALDSYNVSLPDSVDFRNVHSRKIEIKGADTVMTFDGNNEVLIEARLDGYQGEMEASLKICGDDRCDDNVRFANKLPGWYAEGATPYNGVCLGSFIVDKNLKPTGIASQVSPASDAQKKNAPFVQRARNSAVVRNGEKRYKLNGAGIPFN